MKGLCLLFSLLLRKWHCAGINSPQPGLGLKVLQLHFHTSWEKEGKTYFELPEFDFLNLLKKGHFVTEVISVLGSSFYFKLGLIQNIFCGIKQTFKMENIHRVWNSNNWHRTASFKPYGNLNTCHFMSYTISEYSKNILLFSVIIVENARWLFEATKGSIS